jgi:hypothetical protein
VEIMQGMKYRRLMRQVFPVNTLQNLRGQLSGARLEVCSVTAQLIDFQRTVAGCGLSLESTSIKGD